MYAHITLVIGNCCFPYSVTTLKYHQLLNSFHSSNLCFQFQTKCKMQHESLESVLVHSATCTCWYCQQCQLNYSMPCFLSRYNPPLAYCEQVKTVHTVAGAFPGVWSFWLSVLENGERTRVRNILRLPRNLGAKPIMCFSIQSCFYVLENFQSEHERGFVCICVTWTILFAEHQWNAKNAGEASPLPDEAVFLCCLSCIHLPTQSDTSAETQRQKNTTAIQKQG